MNNKTMVENFNELKKVHLQSESPFDSNDGCYIYDALMCIAGSLAVIADALVDMKGEPGSVDKSVDEKVDEKQVKKQVAEFLEYLAK